MKKKGTFVGLAIVIAILLLGIGYAAVSHVTLTINGSAKATPSDNNFKVVITNDPTPKAVVNKQAGEITATPTATDTATADFDITGMSQKGDKVTLTYTIKNNSADLEAKLGEPVVSFTTGDKDYFKVTSTLKEGTNPLAANGGTREVEVVVELLKTPIDAEKECSGAVTIDAEPVQPGA